MKVRLRPRPDDGYHWDINQEGEPLFQKNLSKLSVGIYARLIQGVGRTFRAVPLNSHRMEKVVLQETTSFISAAGLDDEALIIAPDISSPTLMIDWQGVASNETKAREAAENELANCKFEVQALIKRQQALQAELRAKDSTIRLWKARAYSSGTQLKRSSNLVQQINRCLHDYDSFGFSILMTLSS